MFFRSNDKNSNINFIYSIMDGMYDWVRVVDKNHNVLYINSSMANAVGKNILGEKCYTYIGRETPCDNCITEKTINDGTINNKEEIINGRTYDVVSSPIRNDDGTITSVVEVLRDITESKRLNQKIIEQNNLLLEDLAMAKKLEFSLLPKAFTNANLKFRYKYLPSKEIGGDFLSIFNIDETHVGIYIADVSGHGLPASILTVFVNSGLSKRLLSPSEALTELYHRFNDANFSPDLYITVFYAIIDTQNKTMTYSNAGHNVSPIIANDERLKILMVPGIPISNWVDEPDYSDRTITLKSGDKILFSTDGIIELRNENDLQFGEKQLIDILSINNGNPEDIIEEIFISARKFMNVQKINESRDDITVAVIKIN